MLHTDKIKEQVGCNEPANEAQIRICNIKLKKNNLPEIPAEYAELLKIGNGFSNEDVAVFGVEIKNHNWFKDIADFNIAYFHGQEADWLILGEDETRYFLYDSGQKKYFVAEKDDLYEVAEDDDFAEILENFLRIE